MLLKWCRKDTEIIQLFKVDPLIPQYVINKVQFFPLLDDI